jgi:hypothetical protein
MKLPENLKAKIRTLTAKSRQILWRNEAYDISEWKLLNKSALPILIFCSLVLIGNLLFYYLSPYGKITTYDFTEKLPGAESFTSLNKTDEKLELGGMIVKTKSTRFSLNNPKKLSDIVFKFAYKPGQKEIKIGVRGNESDPFVYKSLFFDPINSLTWEKIEQNGLVLYQKNKDFDSIPAFAASVAKDKKIGSYQVDINQLVPMVHPNNPAGKTEITTPIRGNATMYVLVTSGDLKITATKQDMNTYDGADTLNTTVTLGGIKVSESSTPDDGFSDKSKSQAAPQTNVISIPNAKPGVYKVEYKFDSASNDSVITKIDINQAKVVMGGSILAWNNVPTTFYTYSTKITTSTSWAESIQNLKVDDKADLAIKDIKNKFPFDLAKTMKGKPEGEIFKVFSPKGNINFGTDSYFAFSPTSYFDPAVLKMQALTTAISQADIEKNFDYVLTTVAPAKEEDYWLMSIIRWSTKDLNLTGDKVYFTLDIPEIDKQGGSLEVGGLSVELTSK